MSRVVTVFVRNRAEILLTRRSDQVGTYRGRWAGVSGYVEGDPADAVDDARRELREEVGITDATPVRAGDPLELEDDGREWTVHPFLFAVDHRDVDPNWELAETEWTSPTAILDRRTVPSLWATYRRVAPTVETVAADTEHGSAWLSIRALEVLRDEAAVADDRAEVASTARRLSDARPSMAALRNRVARVMYRARRRDAGGDEVTASSSGTPTSPDEATASHGGESASPEAVHGEAVRVIRDVVDADLRAAANAAELLAGVDGAVLTLSRSGTVSRALRRAGSPVIVAESRPAGEGIDVAETLADAGLDVTLVADAAMAFALAAESDAPPIGAVLVGADTVLPDGRIVNKVGTRAACVAGSREGVPCYVAAARDKISPAVDVTLEFGEAEELYDGATALDVWNPTFDVTPADCLDGIVTETGVLDTAAVAAVADQHRQWLSWEA